MVEKNIQQINIVNFVNKDLTNSIFKVYDGPFTTTRTFFTNKFNISIYN